MKSTSIAIDGMSCASCVARVEARIKTIPGVTDASVNLATETADVTYTESMVSPTDVATTLTESGYPSTPRTPTSSNDESLRVDHSSDLKRLTILATVLAIPVFAMEMGSHLFPFVNDFIATTIGTRTNQLIQFFLTTAVLFGPGLVFFKIGIPRLLRGHPDMNSLVALGTAAAYGYSAVSLFFTNLLPEGAANVYFESAVVIVVLILLGRYLEARAKGRTGQAIKKLITLQPNTATVIRDDAAVVVDVESIIPGDMLQIKPGENIAVDGTVVSGSSYVDESMLSGEPTPVNKTIDSTVVAGSINQNGTFTFKATSVGKDTVLAQIISMVESAQGAKLPIQTAVDRISSVFVPIVLLIAIATFVGWFFFGTEPALGVALVAAVSVLIVACPCAMGLATPTSIIVGTGAAAEQGVFFRQGTALQSLQKATVFAFDKTGTLTEGMPELTNITTTNNFNSDEVLQFAASVESASEHPIATALVSAAKNNGLALDSVESFISHTGYGVAGTVRDRQVLIGARRFMQQESIALTISNPENNDTESTGATPIFVAIDGELAARIEVTDPIKSNSRAVVETLQKQGISTLMITGDDKRTADLVAAETGIDQVIAEVLPGDKLNAIKRLQSEGENVAYIGDGINDAPALAVSDTGIALSTGTDVAIEAADVVLMSGNLEGVLRAVKISNNTMRNIKQNLFWAFSYNIVLIPVAAGLLYPFAKIMLSPMLAAAAMALSSIFVVTNALRLRFLSPE